MADFAERVLKLHPSLLSLYYRTMEETDNGVLYDHFEKTNAKYEKEKAEAERNRPRSRRPRGKSKG